MALGPLQLLGDERLAQMAAAGDRRAFDVLFQRHRRGLERSARSIVGNEHDAQDVLQSTALKAFVGLDRRSADAPLRSWLYRIGPADPVAAPAKALAVAAVLTVGTGGVARDVRTPRAVPEAKAAAPKAATKHRAKARRAPVAKPPASTPVVSRTTVVVAAKQQVAVAQPVEREHTQEPHRDQPHPARMAGTPCPEPHPEQPAPTQTSQPPPTPS